MCSKIALPCVSFSHDLSGSELHDGVPYKNKSILESIPEFEFSTSIGLELESSSADELFSNGVILPIQMQEKRSTKTKKHTRFAESQLPPRNPCSPRVDKINKKISTSTQVVDVNGSEKKTESTSFWGISKSRSLHCDAKNYSLLGSSSPPLPRSKSTGSASNLKRVSSKSSSSGLNNLYPVQKSHSGKSYVNSLRVSPVLNWPTPSISKGSASLFGLCSFFPVGKAKKGKN